MLILILLYIDRYTESMNKHRVYVFIDASNVWNAQKAKGKLFDYQNLVTYLKKEHNASVLKVFYYTAYPKKETRVYDVSRKHAFYTYLKKSLGFIVRKKPLKQIRITIGGINKTIEKGDMDVELTLDVVNNKYFFDTMLLFTGDSDYIALVNYLQNNGKKVYVYSSKNNISRELRTGGNGYIDILNIKANI